MTRPVIKYKGLYEDLHKKMQADKLVYEKAIKNLEDKLEESHKAFEKTLRDALPLFMHDPFSEGYLAPDLKYTLKVSRAIKPVEIDILIKKLQYDKEVISTKGSE